MNIDIRPNDEGDESIHVQINIPKNLVDVAKSLVSTVDTGKQLIQEIRQQLGGKDNV